MDRCALPHWMPLFIAALAIARVGTAEPFSLPPDKRSEPVSRDSHTNDAEQDAGRINHRVTFARTVEVVNESALRVRFASLQAERAELYTGDELSALIAQAEQDIEDRKTELAERKKSFDEKIAALQTQLEELKSDAAAIGADISMSLILNEIEEVQKAEGVPRPPSVGLNLNGALSHDAAEPGETQRTQKQNTNSRANPGRSNPFTLQ